MKKKVVSTALVMACLLAAGIGIYQPSRAERNSEEDERFETHKVERRDIENLLMALGVVEPENRVDVKSPVGGVVDRILIEEGARVKAGAILATVSSYERAVLLNSARSQGADELEKWSKVYKPVPILAPISGTIIAHSIRPGQSFSSQDAIFSISDRLIVKAQVNEMDITKVKNGQDVRIILDALPEQVLNGKVKRIGFDSKVINSVSKYVVDLEVLNATPTMRSGMTANVSFLRELRKNALAVPKRALKLKNKQWFISVPDRSDDDGMRKAVEKPVKIGVRGEEWVEIAEGLAEGDELLIERKQEIQYEDDSDEG
jgi:macrolide-specific efflux system membrane fusion protein